MRIPGVSSGLPHPSDPAGATAIVCQRFACEHKSALPGDVDARGPYRRTMCRNITTLRGLEPPATDDEIVAAAAQFVRKVTGIGSTAAVGSRVPVERAVAEIAEIVDRLLSELPARRVPPATVPPLRRPEVQARIAARNNTT